MGTRVQTEVDHAGFRLRNLGDPKQPGDATKTDNSTLPAVAFGLGRPGNSFLAAPADHIHPSVGAVLQLTSDGGSTNGEHESVLFEVLVDFQPIYVGDFVPVFSVLARVSSGPCEVFLRLGGEVGCSDGDIIAKISISGPGVEARMERGVRIPTPVEPTLVKVTAIVKDRAATAKIVGIRIAMSG